LQAAFLSAPGRIELREVPTPSPKKGELLIKVKAALTCGTDLKAYLRGHSLLPMPGPFGHEFSGVIAGVGRGAKLAADIVGARSPIVGARSPKEGDEVMAVHTAPCLKCAYCKKGLYNLCLNIMQTKVTGAFSEYILLPAHIVRQNVFHKPRGLPFEEAAFLEPLSCVVHGMAGLNVEKGQCALVIGGGPIGQMHLLLLKEKGASVTVSDIHRGRLKTAKALGAKGVSPASLGGRAPNIAGGRAPIIAGGRAPFDYVFECTGLPQVWEASVNYLRRGGTLTLFGGCPKGARVSYDAGRLHYDEITLRGVFHYTPSDVQAAYELIKGKRLGLSRLLSGSYPLREVGKAFKRLARGEGIKYAILPIGPEGPDKLK